MEHHVYFWLKEEHQGHEDRQRFEEGLRKLFEIPQVSGGTFGKPADVMKRPVIDESWDYATSMTFDSVESQDAYQVHPAHEAFISEFSTWWDKVQVRDLEAL